MGNVRMKIKIWNRRVATLTVFVFMMAQVLPAGWAEIDPAILSSGRVQNPVLTQSPDNSAETPSTVSSGTPLDTVSFLAGNGAITRTAASNLPSAPAAAPMPAGSLPEAPPLNLTNTEQPATLFYTENDWAETMRDWGGTLDEDPDRFPFSDAAFGPHFRETKLIPFLNLLKDVLTSIRKFAGDVWAAFKNNIREIYVSNCLSIWPEGTTAQALRGSGAVRFNPFMIGDLLKDRFRLMNAVIHEGFHFIGNALDRSLGFSGAGLGGNSNETSTDARAMRTMERIANQNANGRGWREVIGNERTNGDTGIHYFFSRTVRNEIYTVTTNSATGERTVSRFTIGNFDWNQFPSLSGTDYLFRRNGQFMENMLSFSGQSEVYRADNTLARIIQYERRGTGARPGGNNPVRSITYYPPPPVTAPPSVIATAPNVAKVVTVSGTRAATSVRRLRGGAQSYKS